MRLNKSKDTHVERHIVRGFVVLASEFAKSMSRTTKLRHEPGFSSSLRVATIFPKVTSFCLRLSGETGIVSASLGGKIAHLIFEN